MLSVITAVLLFFRGKSLKSLVPRIPGNISTQHKFRNSSLLYTGTHYDQRISSARSRPARTCGNMAQLSSVSNVLTATVLAVMMLHGALSAPPKGQEVVQVDKGVGSITVMVGFLFHYTIPDDAFSGDVAEYQVGEACGQPLPPWLDYDPSTKTFTGFTQASRTTTSVCVKAVGRSPGDGLPSSTAEDVLSITVGVGLTPAFACQESDSVVLATVYVDLTLPELSQEQIRKVLSSTGDALDIAPENIRFTRMKGRYNPERNPVLFSGTGDSEGQQHQGARVQFQVGCSSDSITEDNPFVKFLQEKAPTGALARIIGYPVMDWTVHKGFPRGNRN